MFNLSFLFFTFQLWFLNVTTDIIQAITDWIAGLITMVVSVIDGIVPLFYVAAVGATPGYLTIIGTLGLFGIAFGLVMLGIRFVQSFFLR